uniref:WW domain-containing protein n=1 Tax=Callorhinchus milii TaxID=7868 RepID=A0A4W3HTA1_CALMI
GAGFSHTAQAQVFEEGESLYQNVGILRQELARKPPPPTPPTLEAWETHSDQASGQLFYYNTVSGETTWDSPFQQPDNWEQPAPASPDPSDSVPSDPGIPSDPYEEWESHVDEASGRTYFYHPATGETTWELPSPREEGTPEHMDPSVNLRNQRPPTPEQDYPEIIEEIPEEPWGHRRTPSSWSQDLNSEPESPTGSDIPPGWSCHTDPEGQLLYTSDFTQETVRTMCVYSMYGCMCACVQYVCVCTVFVCVCARHMCTRRMCVCALCIHTVCV